MTKLLDTLSLLKQTLEIPAVKNMSIMGIVLSAFLFGRCGVGDIEKITIEFAEYKKKAEQTKVYADSLKYEVNELMLAVNDNENTISTLRNTVEVRSAQKKKLENSIQQLESQVILAATTGDTTRLVASQEELIDGLKQNIVVSNDIIATQKQHIEERDAQVLALRQTSALAMKRGDTLQTTLDQLRAVKVDDGRWFFGKLKKPSRTTSAIVGVTVGATAALVLTR